MLKKKFLATDIDIGEDVKLGYGLDIVKNDSTYLIFRAEVVLGCQSMFYMLLERYLVLIACANVVGNVKIGELNFRN